MINRACLSWPGSFPSAPMTVVPPVLFIAQSAPGTPWPLRVPRSAFLSGAGHSFGKAEDGSSLKVGLTLPTRVGGVDGLWHGSDQSNPATELTCSIADFTHAAAEFTDFAPDLTDAATSFTHSSADFITAVAPFTNSDTDFTDGVTDLTDAVAKLTDAVTPFTHSVTESVHSAVQKATASTENGRFPSKTGAFRPFQPKAIEPCLPHQPSGTGRIPRATACAGIPRT